MALDKVLKIYDENGNPVDYDILAKDVKFTPDGKDLSTKLAEMEEKIGEGSYQPPATGIPKGDLEQSVQDTLDSVANKVDKVAGKGLSTEDFTAALKAKLEALDPYTKEEVNAAIQEALSEYTPGETVVASVDDIDIVDNPNGQNADTILAAASARMVKEIYLNVKALYQNLAGMAFVGDKPTWQTVPVRTYTIGMASADPNITLTDGNGNAVTSPQSEGTPLTLRLSVANGYRFAAAPTALMDNTNIEFTLDGSYYVAEIGALSGNVVITASSTQVGTYSVNIPTGAVFCTSAGASASAPSIEEGNNVTCYIRPADGRRWVTPPSSASATVTLQSGSIYKIVASNVQADITVSGSTEVIPTYAINLPSAGNGIASVALTDANGNAITSPVLEGTAVKIVLTPANDYSINVTSAKMGQQDLTPTNVNGVLTFNIASVTGAVVITAVAVEVVAHAVRNHLLNMSTSNNATQVEDGDSYTADITADSGATSWDDLRVQVGGTDVTSQCTITDITGGKRLVIPAAVITGNIDIVAAAYTDIVEIKTTADEGTTIKIKGNGSDWNSSIITALVAGDTHEPTDGVFTLAANDTIRFAVHDINEITIGTKTAIKSIDFGGAKVSVQTSQFNGFSNMESFTGMIPRGYRNATYANKLFEGCSSLRSIDLAHFTISISDCLKNCTALESVQIHGFAKGGIPGMLNGCTSIESVDLTDLDISTFASPGMPFGNNSSLKSVDMRGCKFDSATSFSSTVSGLFDGLTALEEVHIDWNTPALTTLFRLFINTNSMKTLDIGKWRAGQSLTYMNDAFTGCGATRIDISGFSTTSSLTNINNAFRGCTNLEELVIGNFDTSELTNIGSAFYQAKTGLSVICTTTTPPAVNTQNNWLSQLPSGSTIYVPDSAVDAYKSAAGWSDYASKIKSINEKV